MATLTITLPDGISACNGKQITFRAPCDCSGVTGLVIDGTTYQLLNAQGESVSAENLFKTGAMVSVLLDTDNNRAYLQAGGGGGGGGFVISTTAPADTSLLWIHSTNKTIKYYNGSAWVAVVSAWG